MTGQRRFHQSLMSSEPYVVLFVVCLVLLLKSHDMIAARESQLERAREEQAALQQKAGEEARRATVAEAKARANEERRPPLIVLPEGAHRFRFASGRSVLSDAYKKALREEIVPLLERESRRASCDILEVMGHTDGQPHGDGRVSNLDRRLMAVLRAKTPGTSKGPGPLGAGDNLGLGMMRAVAVMQFLKKEPRQDRLAGVTILPYSAGQAIAPGDRLATDQQRPDASRRRIELRLRRSF